MPLVRRERKGDEAAIRAVHAASFPTALEARLVDALRASGRLRLSLVAIEDERVVGHVAFSPVTLTGVGAEALGLAPVAVLPEYRRRGIAAVLIRQGLDACRGAGVGFVVLLGEPAYYSRFGFRPAGGWGLADEYDGGDAFQALELSPETIPAGGGLVRYAPEFRAVQDGSL